ncbi:MAG: beta strand repeat-containing protein, partial [Burkholderiaceae bacterium]
SKTYDGTDIATISVGTIDGSGFVNSETVTVGSVSGTFDSANAGDRTATAVYTLANGENGGLANNYSLASETLAPVAIDKAPLTVRANDDAGFYGVTETLGTAGVSYTGFVHGETDSVVTGTASYSRSDSANTNAGTYALSVSGLNAANYDLTYQTGTYTIVPASQLLVRLNPATAVYGSTPTYSIQDVSYLNGSSQVVSLTTGQYDINGAAVSVNDGTTAVSFDVAISSTADDRSAGNYLKVGGYDLGVTNAISTNSVNFSSTITLVGALQVSAKAITLSGITAADKTYDGLTATTLNTSNATGWLSGDQVAVATATGAFVDPNAGTAKSVAITNLTLSGADAGNYTLNTTSTTATINKKALTIAGSTAAGKTYDGNNLATITAGNLSGLVNGETLVVNASGTFDSANAGSRTATAVYTLADGTNGGLASNYTTPANDNNLSATISPKTLSISGTTALGKTYDGTTTALFTPGSLSGLVNGETLVVSASGTFDSANAGTRTATAVYTLGDGTGLASNYTTLANQAGLS